ncbi:MAG: SDR family oxidoreductase [Pseudomonadales bacterium]|nr:SDR family oxidoreductase [Pseudomonadales bacterium]
MTNKKYDFENKVVLDTGGGSGIGRATVVKFANEGSKVVIADHNKELGLEVLESIKAEGGEGLFVQTDVSKTDQVQALINKTVEHYGKLDIGVNNAGVAGGGFAGAADYEEEVWQSVIDINLTGVWLCMKYELQQMLKQGSGAIVNMASILGLVGAESPAYVASKHGVVGLTKSAALSYAKQGIRINAVCPGYIDTPLLRAVMPAESEMEKQIVAAHPINRLGQPEEIAEAVAWLCSDAASFVTGHALPVDGGYVAQ